MRYRQQNWCADGAYDEMFKLMTSTAEEMPCLEQQAGIGALIARVFALACQRPQSGSGNVGKYERFFYSLGRTGVGKNHFHHAVWKLANWGGFEVEIDNFMANRDDTPGANMRWGQQPDSDSIFNKLFAKGPEFGCNDLLRWLVDWKYKAGLSYPHKSGNFDDYTNFLLRWDIDFATLPTGPNKLQNHQGGLAAYRRVSPVS